MCRLPSSSDTLPRQNVTGGSISVGSGTITASVRALMPNHPACTEALALAKSSLPASILYHSFRVFLYAQAFLQIFQDEPDEQQRQPPPHLAEAASATTNRSFLFPPSPILNPSSSSPSTSQPRPSPNPPSRPSPPSYPPTHLFTGCILHAIGTSPQYDTIPERYEIISADVAVRILRAHFQPPTPSSSSSHRTQTTAYLTTQHLAAQQIRDLWLALALHTSPGIAERVGGVVRAVRLAVRADLGGYPLPRAESLGGSGTGAGGGNVMNVVKWGLPRLEIERELEEAVARAEGRERRRVQVGGSWVGDGAGGGRF